MLFRCSGNICKLTQNCGINSELSRRSIYMQNKKSRQSNMTLPRNYRFAIMGTLEGMFCHTQTEKRKVFRSFDKGITQRGYLSLLFKNI